MTFGFTKTAICATLGTQQLSRPTTTAAKAGATTATALAAGLKRTGLTEQTWNRWTLTDRRVYRRAAAIDIAHDLIERWAGNRQGGLDGAAPAPPGDEPASRCTISLQAVVRIIESSPRQSSTAGSDRLPGTTCQSPSAWAPRNPPDQRKADGWGPAPGCAAPVWAGFLAHRKRW